MLLADGCVVCGARRGPVCRGCASRLQPAGPLPHGTPPLVALIRYEGVGRELVTTLKYRHGRGLVRLVGPLLAELARSAPADVVTWIPASRSGRRARGFDQGRLLARSTARVLGLPVRRLLRRGPGRPQTRLGAADRRLGPRLSARGPGGGRVLLLDDVVTTGTSMTVAVGALREEGWSPVLGVALAATPQPRRAPVGPRTTS